MDTAHNRTVCILHNSIKTVWIFRRAYIEELIAEGWSVHCLAPNDSAHASEKLRSLGVNLHLSNARYPLTNLLNLNYRYLRLLINLGYSPVVLCHFISTIVLFAPALLICRRDACFIEGIGTYFTRHTLMTKLCRVFLHQFVRKRLFMNEDERTLLGLSLIHI